MDIFWILFETLLTSIYIYPYQMSLLCVPVTPIETRQNEDISIICPKSKMSIQPNHPLTNTGNTGQIPQKLSIPILDNHSYPNLSK